MGATIYSDNKMQYYPTDSIITMQTLSILSDYCNIKRKYEDVINQFKEEWGEKYSTKPNAVSSSKYICREVCNNKDIHNIIEFNLTNKVVADLFAGQGEWLSLFKTKTIGNNILIGNELEENRYKYMVDNYDIDYGYNLPFEDLELPKKLIDIMLFNPPYGISNGVRNAKKYLKMIFDRDIMNKNGAIVLILNETDILDCMDLITKYLTNLSLYKVHDEEFDKYGQYVLVGVCRDSFIDDSNINQLLNYKELLEGNIALFNYIKENNLQYDYDVIFKYRYGKYSSNIHYKECFENFNYINKNGIKISKKDKTLKWIMNETMINDLSEESLVIPKQLKSGEIANIIASGKINGEISLEDGLGRHIVVGGVKNITTSRTIQVEDKSGEIKNKIETLKQTIPFLNILINDNGKIKIKELGSEAK